MPLQNWETGGAETPALIQDTFMSSSVLPVDVPAQMTTIEMSNSGIP